MKKILLYTECFNDGGIENIIYKIYDGLNKKYQFDILCLSSKNTLYNVSVTNLLKKQYPSSFIRNFLGINKFKRYLENNHYDIIHLHVYNAVGNIYGKIASKYVDKVIVHAHCSDLCIDFLNIKHFINNQLKKIYEDKFNYVSVGKGSADFCFSKKAKAKIIFNGIDYKKFNFNEKNRNKYRKNFKFGDNDFVIGNIGRFMKVKNQDFLLQIFIELNKLKENSYLVLIGTGKDLIKIKRKVKDNNLDDKVIFLKNRKDIPELLSMFDTYVSPALFEGFGVTLAESQINGLPVFGIKAVINEVKISNNTYYLDLKKGKNILAKEILEKSIRRNKDLYLDERYNIKKFIEEIEKLYE